MIVKLFDKKYFVVCIVFDNGSSGKELCIRWVSIFKSKKKLKKVLVRAYLFKAF